MEKDQEIFDLIEREHQRQLKGRKFSVQSMPMFSLTLEHRPMLPYCSLC